MDNVDRVTNYIRKKGNNVTLNFIKTKGENKKIQNMA